MYELAGAAMGCRRGVGVGMMGGQQETVDRRLQVTAAAWRVCQLAGHAMERRGQVTGQRLLSRFRLPATTRFTVKC